MEATMKKIVTMGTVLVALVGLAPAAANAGGGTATNIALGLSSFAVFNQLIGGFGLFGARVASAAPVYYPAAVYAAPAPAYYYYSAPAVTYAPPPPPAPAPPTEVVYPHGKYMLRGDGVTVAYQWVWMPNPPPPPPAPPAPPAAPQQSQGQQ